MLRMVSLVTSIASACLSATQAYSQNLGPSFKGKTIDVIIGFPTGGGNDVYARLLSGHMGRHIPGNPNFVTRNMPGAGSFLAVNHIYNSAPRDGTVIALAAPTIALDERLGTEGVRFKAQELSWLGRMNSNHNLLMTWKTSSVKTFEQALLQETTLSGTGVGSTVSIYPTVLNNVLGTKFKLIMGYRGSNEAMLAMERGEAEGHSTAWAAIKAANPDWIKSGAINPVVQFGLQRHPELKDVPTAIELAKTQEQREILSAVLNATEVGYAFFSTPRLPTDTLAMLRYAFNATMEDKEFLKDADRMRVEIAPLSGQKLQEIIANVINLSPGLAEKVRSASEQGK